MYLPKTKYKGNQYTPGEFLLDPQTGEVYIGAFFETATGEYYTGSAPSKTSKKLSPIEGSSGDSDEPEFTIYDYVRDNSGEFKLKNTLPITLHYPKPSPKDYTKGKLSRYFAIDNKTSRILEISKDVYISMKSKEPKYYYLKYKLKTLTWSLVNVDENRMNTSIEGLDSYLKDPSQFVR